MFNMNQILTIKNNKQLTINKLKDNINLMEFKNAKKSGKHKRNKKKLTIFHKFCKIIKT